MNNLSIGSKNFARDLTKLALFSAIIFVLGTTPFGFIPLGAFKIVTIHIPVIIGSIMLGPKKGAFLGFVFGLSSFTMANVQPNLTSYFFSPIISGNLFSLVVCFVPRILVGIIPYYVFKFLKKYININVSLIITGLIGSLVNTVFVLGFIYIFFAEKYAEILNATLDNLITVILASVGVNATLEALASSILVLAICKALFKNTKV
ncbi:ECF transporter S component [uncultured Tyzzerella sp.]|uniref:ECF transporter S component n=1 Tax=uncultured Tyzzerella sp. TaxID=2321398 RepID=UPI0029422F25|nr:ECF transporter S component [uncultured Tyzzerella sp.]